MIYFKEFEFNKSSYTEQELKSIEIMKEMLKVCGEIYAKQVNDQSLGSNFYPLDATKEEVLKAGQRDSEILSQFTIVKRNESGQLYAVPYNVEYADDLKRLIELSEKALTIVEDKVLLGYIKKLIDAAKNNTWDALENYWLVQEGNNIDLQLAPIEPYLDGLLSIKCAFQGSLRVTSEEQDFDPDDYISTVKAIKMTSSPDVGVSQRVLIRVDDVLARCGDQTLTPGMGSNYPNSYDKVLKLGTKIIISTTNIKEKEKGSVMPLMKKILRPELLEGYDDESLMNAFVRSVLVHEISEAFMKHPGDVDRLKDMYTPVKELHASVIGMKIASQHVLIGALKHKDYECMMLNRFVGRALSGYFGNKNPQTYSKKLTPYVRGYTVTLNYLKAHGAITIAPEGLIDFDFKKAFVCLDELGDILDELMKSKTEVEARVFFDKYEDYKIFTPFDHKFGF